MIYAKRQLTAGLCLEAVVRPSADQTLKIRLRGWGGQYVTWCVITKYVFFKMLESSEDR